MPGQVRSRNRSGRIHVWSNPGQVSSDHVQVSSCQIQVGSDPGEVNSGQVRYSTHRLQQRPSGVGRRPLWPTPRRGRHTREAPRGARAPPVGGPAAGRPRPCAAPAAGEEGMVRQGQSGTRGRHGIYWSVSPGVRWGQNESRPIGVRPTLWSKFL